MSFHKVGRWIWFFMALPLMAVVIEEQPVGPGRGIRDGETVVLQVVATAQLGTPLYQWRFNGDNLRGQTQNRLVLENFQAHMGGRYDVVVAEPILGGGRIQTVQSRPVFLWPDLPELPFVDDFTLGPANVIRGMQGSGWGSNVNATFQDRDGEPLHAGELGGASIWLQWQATQTGVVRWNTHGSGLDTLLAIYSGDPRGDPVRSFEDLVPIASNSDFRGIRTSEVTFNVEEGRLYLIAVDGRNASVSDFGRGLVVLAWEYLEVVGDLRVPEIVLQPNEQLVALEEVIRLQFQMTVFGAVSEEIQWYRDGVPIPDAITQEWSWSNPSRQHVGRHYAEVIVRDARGQSLTNRTEEVDVQLGWRGESAVRSFVLARDRYLQSKLDAEQLRRNASGQGQPPQPRGRNGVRLSGLSHGISGTQIFSTVGAIKEPGEPELCGGIGGASRWYSFYVEEDGLLEVSTEGTDFDTMLAAFYDTGTGSGLFDGLVELACNDEMEPGNPASRIEFPCSQGEIYSVVVDGKLGASGIVELHYRFSADRPPPLIPTFTRVELDQGKLRLWFHGSPNAKYTFQRSKNFVSWDSDDTLVTDADGEGTHAVDLDTGETQWVFRAALGDGL